MSASTSARSGLIAGGNWIVDHVKLIDRWPSQDALANIRNQFSSNGGSPYNVLKNLARLGATFPLEAVGLVGDDEAGRFIRADCAAHRIDLKQLGTSATAPTSYTDVMTEQGSGRRTFFHCRGANAELAPVHFDFSRTCARVFHLGYLLLLDGLDAPSATAPTAAVDVLRAARAAGLKISADVVSEQSDRFATIVRPALPELDYLFLNEFELAQITGIATAVGGTIDPAAIVRGAEEVLRGGVREWVFVHFPAAVLACGARGERLWQPSLRVPANFVQGAAGAGDALASGVLYGLHDGWTVPDSLRLGVCAAAASLAHPTCSEGVQTRAACEALATRFGFNPAPVP
ncbi:carbohydrate kinase family protein [Horticoccus sp. 23ND18S-11]|uniref:carbohydrate kinase family protein n=1 Tax=Horticoccus sp. 23ND18S-11 TaxID=3391832 RepID=UPI0039C90399